MIVKILKKIQKESFKYKNTKWRSNHYTSLLDENDGRGRVVVILRDCGSLDPSSSLGPGPLLLYRKERNIYIGVHI